jgi:hypothetical protein
MRFIERLKGEPIPKGGMEFIWRKPKRTNKQNNYLWGVVYKTLSEALSDQYKAHVTSRDIHKLCSEYFMERYMVPGTDKSVPKSTTELSKPEFSDYVLRIQEFAAKKNIYIPDPQENL